MIEIIAYFKMNGYGFYIWSAYFISTVFIFFLIVSVILRKKKIEKKLLQLENK